MSVQMKTEEFDDSLLDNDPLFFGNSVLSQFLTINSLLDIDEAFFDDFFNIDDSTTPEDS